MKGSGLNLEWFPHSGRADALGQYNPDVFRLIRKQTREFPEVSQKTATGRLDLLHLASGRQLNALVTHQ